MGSSSSATAIAPEPEPVSEETPLLVVVDASSSSLSRSSKKDKRKAELKPLIRNSNIGGKQYCGTCSCCPLWWTRLTFQWLTPLLEQGNQQQKLDASDLNIVPLPHDCTASAIATAWEEAQCDYDKSTSNNKTKTNRSTKHQKTMNDRNDVHAESSSLFSSSHHHHHHHSPYMLFWTLAGAYGADFCKAGVLKLVHDLCLFVGPHVLHEMIVFLSTNDERDSTSSFSTIGHGLYLTATVAFSQLLMSVCLRHYFFLCYKVGLKIRTAVTLAVYRKVLVLSSHERQLRTSGEMTNLVSIDAGRLGELTTHLHGLWYSPLQIALALYFLWQQLGPSSLGGLLMIVLMMPVAGSLAQCMGRQQDVLMQKRDERVKVNAEVLSGMKIVKLQAWEESCRQRVLSLRSSELAQLWRYSMAALLSMLSWSVIPLLVTVTTFGLYVYSGHQLDVATALTSLSLLEIVRFPLFMLPQVIAKTVEAGVSLRRVQSFLLAEEHEKGATMQTLTTCIDGEENPRHDAHNANIMRHSNNNGGDANDEDHHVRDDLCSFRLENVTAAYGVPQYQHHHHSVISSLLLSIKDQEAALLQAQLMEAERTIETLMTTSSQDSIDHSRLVIDGEEEQEPERGSGVPMVPLCLKRIDFQCFPGELILVVGSVGSGKSSLLSTLLGEVAVVAGRVSVNASRVAYHSQTPFILNASVRDNIMFGHVDDDDDDMNKIDEEERYQRALDVCALRHDLDLFPHGDATEIGEKGVTLSGGQKARVALARAVYHCAELTLIDDALSAVDAHVADHLFEHAITRELLKPQDQSRPNIKRSVVLVTNNLAFLNHRAVSRIIVMQEGRIIEQGSYSDLARRQGSVFLSFLSVHSEATENMKSASSDTVIDGLTKDSKERNNITSAGTLSTGVAKMMTDETRLTGHVSAAVYWSWTKAAGGCIAPLLALLIFAFGEAMQVASNWFLTYWSGHGDADNQLHYLMIYAAIIAFGAAADAVRLFVVVVIGLAASRRLFADMLEVVLQAPMSFFDTTPVGRLVNRFSKDIYTIDETLPDNIINYLWTFLNVISTVVVISGVTPVFAVCLVPILMFYASEQKYFTVTYRELKRLDSANQSPVYALLGESIDGAPVIRSFSAETSFLRRLALYVDLQQHAYYLTCAAQSWLAVRLELIGTLIITFACLSSVIEKSISGGNPTFAGLAGLGISYSLMVTQSLNWSVRAFSDLEASMVAVERVKEYSSLMSEGARETSVDSQLPDWPTKGEIDMKGVRMRYRQDLPLVLKGLHLNIPAGSKVGVVGRTGAGKSTLMVALLRIVEIEDGCIHIDGQDIQAIGLAKLRSSIAIIPQDPILFSGTVRSNLDPFADYEDMKLLECLERVGLCSARLGIGSSLHGAAPLGRLRTQSLDDEIAEGGTNFSVGQRQLLVIARALLHCAKIVIMDEATAAIDAETDSFVTKCMRREFDSATVVTVAHRINTIIDSDYILVMSDGMASEFDTPKALLEKGGLFRELVRAASNA